MSRRTTAPTSTSAPPAPVKESRRFSSPDRLPGATSFSKEHEVSGSLQVVRLLKSTAWVWNDLRDSCNLEHRLGRKREPGHWPLAFAAFTVSGQVDIQPWFDNTAGELWRECGFEGRPTYKRVWRRFRELEGCADAVLDAVANVVQHAKRWDSRVAAHVHIDGTEDETHAMLHHDCQPGEECGRPDDWYSCGRGHSGYTDRPQRETSAVARSDRQALAEEAPPAGARDPRLRGPEKVQITWRDGRQVKRLRSGGCWFVTLDIDAGVRSYSGPRGGRKFWHGYTSQKATDHLTGGVLFTGVYNASYQEFDLVEDVYANLTKIAGKPVETLIGDRGYSVEKVFRLCIENGTAPIFPWRKHTHDGKRHDQETHDRHGVRRCKGCGGPTRFIRHHHNGGKPRAWVRCANPLKDVEACKREQTYSLLEDPINLVPLWRTDPLYHELKQSHASFEAVHDWWRDRYKVAGTGSESRPKVRGIGAHRLRANMAALIEWLRICFREGLLGSARRNHGEPERRHKTRGERAAESLRKMRARMGLLTPYGKIAKLVGAVEDDTVPSRRLARDAVDEPPPAIHRRRPSRSGP